MSRLVLLFISFLLPVTCWAEYPIFDVHIHYSDDLASQLSPEAAVRILQRHGIETALVSSTADDSTQRIYAAAPEFVIPVLRPYRKRGTLRTWMHDASVIPYLEQRLAQHRYVAIGEFHLVDAEADTPVVRRIVELARQHDLFLHVHGDAPAIDRLYRQDPNLRILWAHAGFEDAEVVRDRLSRYDTLWADLSYRGEIFHSGKFLYGWQALLTDYADRFMLGVDTYTPQRWTEVDIATEWMQALLAALPEPAAEQIAWRNGERVFRAHFANRAH